MGIVNMNLWQKSYMLEFLKGDVLEEVFTFSLPPESEELKFTHRINETKTFGGSIFDSYGNDTISISLSGNTANEDLKFIYRGLKKLPKFLSGEKEIFELQKLITEWNKVDSDNKEKKVFLYDLSKMNLLQIATGIASRNYWRVFIKSLDIKRDKTKPNVYNYSLDMYGVIEESKKGFLDLGGLASVVDKITNVLDTIQTISEYTEGAAALITESVSLVEKSVEFFNFKDNSFNTVMRKMDGATRLLTGNQNNLFYNTSKEILASVYKIKKLCSDDKTENKDSEIKNNSSFIILFKNYDDSVFTSQEIEYSEKLIKPENPIYDRYSFVGWYKDKELIQEYDFNEEVKESFSLYSKWELAEVIVSFNSRGGSAIEKQRIQIGQKAAIPETPIRKGYVFKSWNINILATIEFDFNTPIFADTTLYASYDEVFTIVFDTDGGSKVENQVIGRDGRVLYPLTPKKDNYVFSFWAVDKERTLPFDFSINVISDLTLYAVYVQTSNTVLFESNGGTEIESQTIKIGELVQKPENPIREGYDFIFWCSDRDLTNEFKFTKTVINKNITLYAKWSTSVYSVDFDSDGGSEVASQNVNHGLLAIFPVIPTKENCVFSMWQIKTVETKTQENEQESAGEIEIEVYKEFDFSTPITQTTTLKALWLGASE